MTSFFLHESLSHFLCLQLLINKLSFITTVSMSFEQEADKLLTSSGFGALRGGFTVHSLRNHSVGEVDSEVLPLTQYMETHHKSGEI